MFAYAGVARERRDNDAIRTLRRQLSRDSSSRPIGQIIVFCAIVIVISWHTGCLPFDSVSHVKLIEKLQAMNVDLKLIKWIAAFLHNRQMRVKVDQA